MEDGHLQSGLVLGQKPTGEAYSGFLDLPTVLKTSLRLGIPVASGTVGPGVYRSPFEPGELLFPVGRTTRVKTTVRRGPNICNATLPGTWIVKTLQACRVEIESRVYYIPL